MVIVGDMPLSKRIGQVLFCFFVFVLPWQTRWILTPEKSEFFGFSIYLSEIFLWLALAFWLANTDLRRIKTPIIFLVFYIFSFLSILWSEDRVVAFRIWLYVFDGLMVYIFLRKHEDLRQGAVKIFLFSLFASAIFGIWQFFALGSPAFKWLGLSGRGAWNLGDIVVENGGRFLRAYGSFPHPNIFGGYLATGILLLIAVLPLRRSENKISPFRRRGVSARGGCALGAGGDLIIFFLAGILFLALFLTFSRSAWLAFAIALVYLAIKNSAARKFFIYFLFLAVALSVIFWPLIKTRATSSGRLEAKSNVERMASWKDGLAVWLKNPIFGTGAGNSTKSLQLTAYSLQPKQPPHNIFILILSELGIFGFLIYLFIWKKMWQNPAVRPLLILFFIIGFFDHYLWTLYSGQALFWAGIAFLRQDDKLPSKGG